MQYFLYIRNHTYPSKKQNVFKKLKKQLGIGFVDNLYLSFLGIYIQFFIKNKTYSNVDKNIYLMVYFTDK